VRESSDNHPMARRNHPMPGLLRRGQPGVRCVPRDCAEKHPTIIRRAGGIIRRAKDK